jgi:hypothetical protein
LSELAVKILVPWGLKQTFEISPSWPINIAWHAPVCVLYTRAVPSADAVTNYFFIATKTSQQQQQQQPLTL